MFSRLMQALSQGLWVLNSNSATSCLALCDFELNAGSKPRVVGSISNSFTSCLALCVFDLNGGS